MEALGVFGLLSLFVIYLFPAGVALWRGHPQAVSIGLLNLLLGWSIIGWILSLVWSATAIPREARNAPAVTRRVLLGVIIGVPLIGLAVLLIAQPGHVSTPTEQTSDWHPNQDPMRFQTWWNSGPELSAWLPITRTLAKRNQTGCASLSWASSVDYEHVYLVACIGRSDKPSFYIVRTDTQQIFRAATQTFLAWPQCHPWENARCLVEARAHKPGT